jgi:hypothetical protein
MLRSGVSDVLNLEKMLTAEWLGQTIASSCWIVSVFVYADGALPGSTGDWLQLAAASSWMVANISSILSIKQDS